MRKNDIRKREKRARYSRVKRNLEENEYIQALEKGASLTMDST